MAFPSSASAHAGQTDPVASSYRATITSVVPGLTAKVVDGDQRLWMSADPRLTVIVVGRFGEPYLRFSSAGVDENLRSPTTYLNRATPVMVPSGANPRLPPAWKHLTDSHSYIWHEDRLHVLAGRSSAPGDVGPWVVPVTVNGREEVIRGQLWRAADPSLLWFWPAVVILACVVALLRVRDQRITRTLGRMLALAAVVAVVVARIGVELYGHPGVSTWQHIDLALTGLLAVLVIVLLLRPRGTGFVAFVAGTAGVYQGVVLLPTLTEGYVLAAVPATIERAAGSVAIACGIGAMLSFVFADGGAGRSGAPVNGRRGSDVRLGVLANDHPTAERRETLGIG
jgi:hypothetical protein